MRSIHPQNFITIAIIVLEICTGQKSSLKVNKGQSLKKKKKSKQELWFMCTALPLDEIYPPTNFITIVSTVLEMCSGQNSSMKINKGQKLKNKATKSNSSYALHSPLMRSIHPQNLITIASIVLEICTGQKSSMKINKGQ